MPDNSVRDFAARHSLSLTRVRLDDCGDVTLTGKRGDVYEHSANPLRLAVTILRCPSSLHWNKHHELLRTAGCVITQNGDMEGTAVFDPANEAQTQAVLEAIRPRRKRQVKDPSGLVSRLTGRPANSRTTKTGENSTPNTNA